MGNIPPLKAYLPALGKDAIAALLQRGADDLNGTMYDGTKIYAPLGNATAAPAITMDKLRQVCTQAGNSEYVLNESLFELDDYARNDECAVMNPVIARVVAVGIAGTDPKQSHNFVII